MEKKFVDREYLVRAYQGFLDAEKVHLTGALPDLNLAKVKNADGTERDKVLVEAINEVIEYITNGLSIESKTYAEWSAAAVKDQLVDTDSKVVTKMYYISDAFTYGDGTAFGDGRFYQAGSIIYASTYHIDPADADPTNTAISHDYYYDWRVLDNPSGLIGDTSTLETSEDVLVPAINEVLKNLQKMDDVEDKTFAQFSANDIKYQEAPADKYHFKAYRITDGFLWDGKWYQAGSIIYAIGIKDITTPVTRTVYEWRVLPLEGGSIGQLTTLDGRVPTTGTGAVDTVVDAMNHMFVDMEVTMDTTTTTAGQLKSYTIYQGTDTATRVKIGVIDIPKDMVITGSKVITADGTEVTGKDSGGFDVTGLTADKRYLQLDIANQDYPVYIDIQEFIKVYVAEESAAQVQLKIDGENVISGKIVEDSITHTELDKPTEAELDFVGYNHDYDDTTNADYGHAQLDTTAQKVRDAINELYNDQFRFYPVDALPTLPDPDVKENAVYLLKEEYLMPDGVTIAYQYLPYTRKDNNWLFIGIVKDGDAIDFSTFVNKNI